MHELTATLGGDAEEGAERDCGVSKGVALLVCPSSSLDSYASGNWKDLRSLQHVLADLGIEVRTVMANGQNATDVLQHCTPDVTDVVVQYSFWPELLSVIRKRLPRAGIHVRTVNAEALQHWQRSEVRVSLSKDNLRSLYGCARLAYRDMLCRQRADHLLGISEWDDANYWRRLPGRAPISSLPYYSPWPGLRSHVVPLPWNERRNEVVCLAGGNDRIGKTQVEGLVQLAEASRESGALPSWRFSLSPGVYGDAAGRRGLSGVHLMDVLDEPWDLLCSVKALAILTPLGFGTKTTIVDALAAGCHVLVHPVLAQRLPKSVRMHCISADPASPSQLVDALRVLDTAPPTHAANTELHRVAQDALSRCLAMPRQLHG